MQDAKHINNLLLSQFLCPCWLKHKCHVPRHSQKWK